jgi:hypothetical protein
MKTKMIKTSILSVAMLVVALFGFMVSMPASANTPTPTKAAPTVTIQTTEAQPASTVNDEASRYAQRETKAKNQANFKGGEDYVVVAVSTTTLVIVLVVLLLL